MSGDSAEEERNQEPCNERTPSRRDDPSAFDCLLGVPLLARCRRARRCRCPRRRAADRRRACRENRHERRRPASNSSGAYQSRHLRARERPLLPQRGLAVAALCRPGFDAFARAHDGPRFPLGRVPRDWAQPRDRRVRGEGGDPRRLVRASASESRGRPHLQRGDGRQGVRANPAGARGLRLHRVSNDRRYRRRLRTPSRGDPEYGAHGEGRAVRPARGGRSSEGTPASKRHLCRAISTS
jgi:hypothetical protein